MWIRPRQLIYTYFCGTIVAFITIFYFISTWSADGAEIELERKKVQILETKLKNYQQKEGVLTRRIDELKSEIDTLEKKSKQNENKMSKAEILAKLDGHLPMIYVVTPTHNRMEQKADLTRLSYTLRHVSKLHWIVVEDSGSRSKLVTDFLQNSNLVYTHLSAKTPPEFKMKQNDPNWLYPRGVQQRNAALDWLRENAIEPSVVYLADDDNTYDLHLFDEVIGWHTYWKPNRQFAMDMAGFAMNIQLLKTHPYASFRMSAGRGNLESDLLVQLGVELSDLEPRADNCTKVLVWHTRTEKSSLKNEQKMMAKYGRKSNTSIEYFVQPTTKATGCFPTQSSLLQSSGVRDEGIPMHWPSSIIGGDESCRNDYLQSLDGIWSSWDTP